MANGNEKRSPLLNLAFIHAVAIARAGKIVASL